MSYFQRVMIYPYNVASRSAKFLKQELIERGIPTKLIRKEGSRYVPREGDMVINWGNSEDQLWHMKGRQNFSRFTMINQPSYVGYATNKAKAFHQMERSENISLPKYFRSVEEAIQYSQDRDDHFDLILREKLTGHGGEGAHFIPRDEVLTTDYSQYDIKLVTQYIPKKYEYRIHVGQGRVMLVQQKKRDTAVSIENVNWKIRNNANGFIFAVDDIVEPSEATKRMACHAVGKLGLEFGAVDIIYNEHYDQAYVLEVNTACGLEGESSRQAYGQFFATYFEHGTSMPLDELLSLDSNTRHPVSDEDMQRLQSIAAGLAQRNEERPAEERRPSRPTSVFGGGVPVHTIPNFREAAEAYARRMEERVREQAQVVSNPVPVDMEVELADWPITADE